MRARSREAVSNYLSTFLLIGVAVGGTGIVIGATSNYTSALGGASVSVAGAGIMQGAYMAVERLTVFNSGGVPEGEFTISTPGAPASASYCYTLTDPKTMAKVTSTCPAMSINPSVVAISDPLPPGGAVLVDLTIGGNLFSIGTGEPIMVTSSTGAQQSLSVQVAPA